jgi:soluble lytic murein transglycosylase-like protein
LNNLNANSKAVWLGTTVVIFAFILLLAGLNGHISLASLPGWNATESLESHDALQEEAPRQSNVLWQPNPTESLEADEDLFTRFIMDNNRKIFTALAIHISKSIMVVSKEYNIPPVYLLALAYVESTFRYDAVSEADCVGLLQINPAVWLNNTDNEADLSAAGIAFAISDLYDPETNLRAGAHIFSHYYNQAKEAKSSDPLKYALTKYLGGDKNNHYAKFIAAVGKFVIYKETK